MPKFAIIFAIAMLSSAGLPLLNGFIGEFTILQGAFEANRIWAAFAVTRRDPGRGVPALAVPADHARAGDQRQEPDDLPDLNLREMAIFAAADRLGDLDRHLSQAVLRHSATSRWREIVERVRPGLLRQAAAPQLPRAVRHRRPAAAEPRAGGGQ